MNGWKHSEELFLREHYGKIPVKHIWKYLYPRHSMYSIYSKAWDMGLTNKQIRK